MRPGSQNRPLNFGDALSSWLMSERYVQITTAAPSRETAEAIAETLVEQRLAACVQVVGPVASTYRWQGAVERAEEWLCLIKTEQRLFEAVERTVRALHPYETPEIVATPIVEGSAAYLAWIGESLRSAE
jgi:periplasmic divalent cation tolerance protein